MSTGGDPGLLQDAEAWLRREGLRPSARTAKLERALAGPLAERERRSAADGHRSQAPAGSAGAVVLAYLRQQVTRLQALDPLVRAGEPDSVHQMRVTARRLRSTLQSFGQVLPRSRTAELVAGLKWLGVVLGEARDAEVLAGRLDRELRDTPPELVLGPAAPDHEPAGQGRRTRGHGGTPPPKHTDLSLMATSQPQEPHR